ncbi:UNVERIFIED_ORG: hypothetical protein FNL38_102258 [Nocardia globerula]|uniref:Cytochrome P450 n=1 Tax=Nocardia globerula TaxID=1818 RepID=A0A652YTA6_NOCGL|nr:cytochrome P450 [Rhodococcus globerulus]NMD61351.1 cytochrome P450 [Nocardia globerula]PVX67097.1 hypothetical protein C8E04_4446 [Rhodococcus globerulus]
MTSLNTKGFGIDFDHHGPEFVADPYAIMAALQSKCPVAHSKAWDGFWVFTGYEEIFEAQQRPDVFGNGVERGIPQAPNAQPLIPIHYDGPDLARYRSFLLGTFSPASVKIIDPTIRALTNELIDTFIERGAADLSVELFTPLPARVFLRILGVDDSNWRDWVRWVHCFTHDRTVDPKGAAEGIAEMYAAIAILIAGARANPRPGLLGDLVSAERDGRRLDDAELSNMIFMLTLGGMDTTAGLTGNSLLRIAESDSLRQDLLDDPALLDKGTEEFLRYSTPTIGQARYIKSDIDFHGRQLKAGDRVYLMYAAANRDPSMFEDPDSIDIRRKANRHMSFAVGAHRCLGSNLARAMFRTMISSVLDRIPDFRVDLDAVERYPDAGDVYAVRHLPVTFTPGDRVDGVASATIQNS